MRVERYMNIGVILVCVVALSVIFINLSQLSDRDILVKNLDTKGR